MKIAYCGNQIVAVDLMGARLAAGRQRGNPAGHHQTNHCRLPRLTIPHLSPTGGLGHQVFMDRFPASLPIKPLRTTLLPPPPPQPPPPPPGAPYPYPSTYFPHPPGPVSTAIERQLTVTHAQYQHSKRPFCPASVMPALQLFSLCVPTKYSGKLMVSITYSVDWR